MNGQDERPTAVEIRLGSPERWRKAGWGVVVVGALLGLVWVAAQVRSVTIPLLIAFTVAYILDPVVDRFERRGVRRTPAIAILLTVFGLVLAALVLLVGPQIVRELAVLPDRLLDLLRGLLPWVRDTFGVEIPGNVQGALDMFTDWVESVEWQSLAAPAGDVVTVLYGGTVGVLTAVAGLVMIPLFAFYLLRDFDVHVAELRELVPVGVRDGVVARFREIDAALSSFVRGQLVVAAILAVLYSLGLWAVGLPLALVVGILSGLGNMVPYLGTTIGVILATLMYLLDWQGLLGLVLVYGVFVVVQTLEGYVITPRIVGGSVGLTPFAVIVAVLIFGDLFGFFGILIAVPLAAVLKILLRVAVERYRASTFYAPPPVLPPP